MKYHHGNLRQALLDAAGELIEEEGYHNLSLRGTARKAGVSQTAPYRHFSEKDQLLAAVAAEGFDQLSERMREAATQHDGARDQLKAIGQSYLEFALGNPHLFRLMFGPLMARGEEYPEMKERCDGGYQILLSVLGHGQRQGVFRQAPVELLGVAAWAQVHGVAHLAIDGVLEKKVPEGVDFDGLVDSVCDLLVEGLTNGVKH